MRILRVAQKVYPDVTGGGPYHVHAMSRDQAAMGHDVTVLTVRRDGDAPRYEERDGYMVVRRDATVSPLGNDLSIGLARELWNADGYDVVHAHSHLYFATNLAALRRRFSDVPLALTNHGLYSQNAPEWLFDAYLRSVGRWTFNSADVVFCYTDEDGDRVREFGVGSRIEVVPNGVDTDRFRPGGPTSERVDHDGPVVLFVGRLVDGKRPLDALRAISRLDETWDPMLYVVGDGPMREEVEEQADDRVAVLGQVPYEEMPAIYRSAEALVLPSRAEGLPRTVLEAMASGVPVVVSDLAGVASVVDGGGVTVPVGDVDGFAAGIEQVLDGGVDDPRSVIEGSYSWEETVARTTAMLEGL